MMSRTSVLRIKREDLTVERRGKEPLLLVLSGMPPRPGTDELADALGLKQVTVRIYGANLHNRPKWEWERYCELATMPLSEYLEMLRTGEAARCHAYLAQQPIDETPLGTTLAPVFEGLRRTFGTDAKSSMNLWLGPAGHVEPLHFDPFDGMLIQLLGRKTVRLFPPEVSSYLHPFPLWAKVRPWFSQVTFSDEDCLRFPDSRIALSFVREAELGEGEALYIPAGWWHEVRSFAQSPTLSINQFWGVRPLRRLLRVDHGAILYASFAMKRSLSALARWVRSRLGH